jgi:lysophospholipase L1-like esterase
MKRLVTGIAVSVAMLAMPAAAQASTGSAHARPWGSTTDYYLALGDSLSVGDQPNSAGTDEPTSAGYPNQLYSEMRWSYSRGTLDFADLGCPGETTATLLNGGICSYSGDQRTSYTSDTGSQLDAALAFIADHPGHVPLITLDIGANDLNPCIAKGTISGIEACLPAVFAQIGTNLSSLLSQLKAADPTATIVGMNYYDPELEAWTDGTTAGQTFAEDSIVLSGDFNDVLGSVYGNYSVPVADVADAFHTDDFTTLVPIGPRWNSELVPEDVAEICKLTWECAPAPQGPNEHCNWQGYAVIASTFLSTPAIRQFLRQPR